MSENTAWLTQYEKLVLKHSESVNKENDCSIGKSSTSNNKAEKRKGLSVNTESQATSTAQLMPTIAIDKSNFQVYCDSEHNRSRSRVRKLVDKKRLRAKTESAEKPPISTLQAQKENIDLRIVPRRARSSINFQTNRTCSQRSHSESRQFFANKRKISVTPSQGISQDVKQRTIASIQEWKNRMSKPQTGTIPKQNVKQCSTQKKIKKESVKKSTSTTIDSVKPKSKRLLNEVTSTVFDTNILHSHIVSNTNNIVHTENDQNKTRLQNGDHPYAIKSLDNFANASVSTKICHENHGQMQENTRVFIKENEVKDLNITLKSTDQFIHEWHLEYVPEIEREREQKAPKLSSRFLQENINVEQRKIIVEYLIRLGVRCNYPSYIIYQTVKLFNVAIDRVLVELKNVQLLALTAFWIVLKREVLFHKIPTATTVLEYAKDLYTKQESNLLQYERKILSAVKFNTRFADPYSLLLYYTNRVNYDSQYQIAIDDIIIIYFCGSYLLDVSMLDEELCDTSECILAMAAAELALHFIHPNKSSQVSQAWCELWRRKHLMEWEERAIYFVKRRMIHYAALNKSSNKTSSYVIYKKYLRSTYCKISKFLLENVMSVLSKPEFS